jgi:MFS family permease
MIGITLSIFSLLLATTLLLLGIGLQGTLLGLRAVHEAFSVTVIGYVMSSYFIGMALGTYLCPLVIRRVGHIRAYAAMAAIASSAAISFVLVIDPYAWALLRIITGVCMVGLYMVVESWLNVQAPNNLRGQFFGIYMTATFVALALSQYLLLAEDIAGFTLFAVTSILISTALVPITLTRVQQPHIVKTPRLHLVHVYRDSPLGVFGTLTAGIVMGGFWGMMPVYGSQTGMNTNSIVWLMSITIFGGAILQWPIGKISDLIDRRIVLGFSTLAAAVLAYASSTYGETSPPQFYMIYFLYGGFAFSIYSLSVAHINDRLRPEQALDASQNLLQIYGIGAVAGPALAGVIMKHLGAGSLPLFFTAVLLIAGIFTIYRVLAHPAPAVEYHEKFITMQRTSPVAMEMDPRNDSDPNINNSMDSDIS